MNDKAIKLQVDRSTFDVEMESNDIRTTQILSVKVVINLPHGCSFADHAAIVQEGIAKLRLELKDAENKFNNYFEMHIGHD